MIEVLLCLLIFAVSFYMTVNVIYLPLTKEWSLSYCVRWRKMSDEGNFDFFPYLRFNYIKKIYIGFEIGWLFFEFSQEFVNKKGIKEYLNEEGCDGNCSCCELCDQEVKEEAKNDIF